MPVRIAPIRTWAVALISVTLLSACTAAPRPPPEGPGAPDTARLTTPDSAYRIIGYLASWGVRTKGVRITRLPADRLTHIFYAFGGIAEDGTAELGDPCLDIGDCDSAGPAENQSPGGNFGELLRLKQRYPHLKILISLGGWGGSRYFSDVAATSESRRRLVESTIDLFIRRWPGLFDGIDVDWEFPVSGGMADNVYRPDDKQNYTLLLAEFRRQLYELGEEEGRSYLLSIAASARPAEIANLELHLLPRYLDWINVMTYDYHSVDTIAHFNAPLYAAEGDPTPELNVHASMQAFLEAGVPPRQLVVGVPFYGRGYGDVEDVDHGLFQRGDRSAAGDWGPAGIDYRELVSRKPMENGFERLWHPDAEVPWLYNRRTGIWISYDDTVSVARKADYVREHGFGGIMFWELGGDDGTLLDAIYSRLHRLNP